MNNIEELSKPIAWTDAEELADLKQYSYCTIWSVDRHQPGTDETRKVSIYSQGYVDALIAQLEAAQKSNAFLKEQMAQLANFNPDWDRLEACQESWRELAELQKETLHRAEKAEAELSAANEKLAQPVVLSSSTVMSRACAVRAIKAAGFTVEGGE